MSGRWNFYPITERLTLEYRKFSVTGKKIHLFKMKNELYRNVSQYVSKAFRFQLRIHMQAILLECLLSIKWMNEFLEQLVRDLQMPTAEVKSVLWAYITWLHKSAKLSWSSLLLGANSVKATTLDPTGLSMLCLFPISVFFTHSLLVVLRRGQGTISKRRKY